MRVNKFFIDLICPISCSIITICFIMHSPIELPFIIVIVFTTDDVTHQPQMEMQNLNWRHPPWYFWWPQLRKFEELSKKYRKDLGNVLSHARCLRLEVCLNLLRIYKNHEEIQDFILVYNLRFKSKLVFDLFLEEGLRRVC